MILFNRYEQNKGKYHISPTLLWEYDLRHFDWQQARSIVAALGNKQKAGLKALEYLKDYITQTVTEDTAEWASLK